VVHGLETDEFVCEVVVVVIEEMGFEMVFGKTGADDEKLRGAIYCRGEIVKELAARLIPHVMLVVGVMVVQVLTYLGMFHPLFGEIEDFGVN